MKHVLFVVAIAALFGVAGTSYAKGDAATGKVKAAACGGCHGANGEGKAPYPALAGKSEEDIEHALQDYKSGKRANGIMKSFAAKLSEKDMEDIGAYYASLKGK